MAVLDRTAQEASLAGAGNAAETRPRHRAVMGWAVLGAACMAVMIYVFASWIFSDDFRPIGTGSTPVPLYMTIAARTQEILFFGGMVTILYFVVWRKYRREGKLSLDALVVLAMFWCWWQDPLYAYVTSAFDYSSVSFNWGGWACKIPGFNSPNGCHIPQPLIWDVSFYILGVAGLTIGIAALLRRWCSHHPKTSGLTLMVATFVFYYLLDLVVEFSWVRLGLYHYGGGVKGLNLFAGHWYQFPLYESLAVATMLTAMTALRFFVNDRGETLVERGASELRVSARMKTVIRYLALVGAFNMLMLFGWAVVVNIFNVNAGAWPQETQQQSYFTTGVCGPGTAYACPGDHVATPRPGRSVHIGPQGQLVIPPGTDMSAFAVGGN